MNTKIENLIALCTTIEKGPPNWGMTANTEIPIFDKEKFAILIARECLSFIEPAPGMPQVISDIDAEAAASDIKEHFGM